MPPPENLPPSEPNRDTGAPLAAASQTVPQASQPTPPERTPLSATPAEWFERITDLNPAVHLACTPVAHLGIQGPLSPIRLERHPVLPRTDCGRLQPNLAEHAGLFAVHEAHAADMLHALEVRDARGRQAHRIVLSTGASFPAWLEFTTAHSLPRGSGSPWFPANHAASTRRVGALTGRIRFLRQHLAQSSPAVRRVSPGNLVSLLQQAIASELPIRTSLYNRAVILTSTWTPEFQAPDLVALQGAEPRISRFFGGDTGLQLHQDPDLFLALWTGTCACCGREKWAIEMGTPEGELALALTAPDASQEDVWRQFLIEYLE